MTITDFRPIRQRRMPDAGIGVRCRRSQRRPSTPASRPSRPDGAALEPLFCFRGRPGGLAVDARENIWLSDSVSATIWQVRLDGTAEPVLDRDVGQHRLYSPTGIAVAADGSVVVAETTAHRISTVGMDGSVRILAGNSSGFQDGPAGKAAFRFPRAVAVSTDGAVFVADAGNDRIRRVSPDGRVSTLAGSIYDYGDGTGMSARFRRPAGLTIDREGVLYVADTGNNAIRRVQPDGQVVTVAGSPPGGNRDGGPGRSALRWPSAVAAGDDGWLWVADYGNGALRLIDPDGETTTVFQAGLGWPAAVAALPGQRAVIAGSTPDDRHGRSRCPRSWALMVVGG